MTCDVLIVWEQRRPHCLQSDHWFSINISSKVPTSPCCNQEVDVFNGVISLAIVKQRGGEKEEFLIPIISNGVRFVEARLPILISHNILCFMLETGRVKAAILFLQCPLSVLSTRNRSHLTLQVILQYAETWKSSSFPLICGDPG